MQPVPVTVDNFKRAESDMYFSTVAVQQNSLGKTEGTREARRRPIESKGTS
jgi:hypothetical protein